MAYKDLKLIGSEEPDFRCKKIGWRIFLVVFGLAIIGCTIGLVVFYMTTDSNDADTITTKQPGFEIPTITVPQNGEVYYVGVARTDVTGPIVQVNMMGYAHPEQIATGLHTRLYSRAFVIADANKANRVAFVSFDSGMTSQLLKLEIIRKLQERLGDVFNEKNVVISGTHTHSGPAGFFQYLLFEVTSLGHVNQSTEAFIDGIADSIEKANSNLQQSHIKVGSANVSVGNINRSPTSYLCNPEEERRKYDHDTDQEITVMRFDTVEGEPLGMISWYPVHPTNMNFSNTLINSDNKGRASMLFENKMRKPLETQTGNETFVAAFAQSNQGDVSPRTNGPICVDTGLDCEPLSSTCNNRSQNCIGFGPGKDMFESTDMIARRQLDAAWQAYQNASDVISGPVGWVHRYVDVTQSSVTLDDGTNVQMCKPGLGYSFAAGCTDGAGAFDFVQGMTKGTEFWDTIRDVIARLVCSTRIPQTYYNCHSPKPVLLPTGYMDIPRDWHPDVVDVQMLRVGQFLIAAVPGEFSTMAGRRFRERLINDALTKGMPDNSKIVIAGLSNVYTHYITTPEEYMAQRYEAASTIYGPNTYRFYEEQYESLLEPLIDGTQDSVPSEPTPLISPALQRLPPPPPDMVPENVNFGDVIENVNLTYNKGEFVRVKFYGANPRHDMKLESSYLTVQQLVATDWVTVYNDADWSTRLHWEQTNATTNATADDITLFSALFDVIADVTGTKFDLRKAMKLHEEGKFLGDDVTYSNSIENDGAVMKGEGGLLESMEKKGLLYPESENRAPKAAAVESYVTIEWEIPLDQESGKYQILYDGNHLSEDGTITPFQGNSLEFDVL